MTFPGKLFFVFIERLRNNETDYRLDSNSIQFIFMYVDPIENFIYIVNQSQLKHN